MIYFIKEVPWDSTKKNAGTKARNDVDSILESIGAIAIESQYREGKRKKIDHFTIANMMKKSCLDVMKQGDVLVIQFPIVAHTIFVGNFIKKLKKQGIKVILLIHDMETLREALQERTKAVRKLRISLEEMSAIKSCSSIIVHNEKMSNLLCKIKDFSRKIVLLEIFDYLIPAGINCIPIENYDYSVIIAGNLARKKTGYVYKLPQDVRFNLYGIGYEEAEITDNIAYHGSFLPDDLIQAMQGHFGLVWDGPEADSCVGEFGGYLRYNNPHKTSLYIACGLPVIIWDKAALAPFIIEHNAGITVASLSDIKSKLDQLTPEKYNTMKDNVGKLSYKLKDGYYTKKAMDSAVKYICNTNTDSM